jgi:hypothetical protein
VPGPLPRFILPLDENMFPDRIDRIERPATAGTDASGIAVPAWTVLYTALPCLADLHEAGERGTGRGAGGARGGAAAGVFGQPVEEMRAAFYVPALPGGGLPDVRKEDRIAFGTWPDGSTRYVDVAGAFDAGHPPGIVQEIIGSLRKPG